ncbi:MAG UNVERIFIED_CONTAM: trigger factor [Rickettsiaceae bacterium]|jgi:trigger factor
MKIEKIKDEALEQHFKIVIPAKEITSVMELELKKIASTIKMAGFRAGKVPLSIVSKKYGGAVRADAIENKVKEVLTKVMKDNKINPAMAPDIEDMKADEGKDVSFIAKFEILPEITHPDLKKIKLEKPVVKVDTKDIDKYLEDLIENNPSYTKPSKTKAEKGDQLVMDFEGFINGKAFDGGMATNQKLVLGSGQFIPGFEDQLIGAKAGTEVKVKVTFPETYHAKDLAGKEAVFETKIHDIFKPEKPKIDNDLGKKFGFEDLEALKKM